MFTNLPEYHQLYLGDKLKLHVSFIFLLWDYTGFIRESRDKLIAVLKIQRVWREYQRKKNLPPPASVLVYARNYNFLRIMSGMAGLSYSS